MSVQLHPDIETLDKESLCYSIYAQLYHNFFNAQQKKDDEHPYGIEEGDETSLRLKNTAYGFASAIAGAVTGEGGSGSGGLLLDYLKKSGGDMTGKLSANYGFEAGIGNTRILETYSQDITDPEGVVTAIEYGIRITGNLKVGGDSLHIGGRQLLRYDADKATATINASHIDFLDATVHVCCFRISMPRALTYLIPKSNDSNICHLCMKRYSVRPAIPADCHPSFSARQYPCQTDTDAVQCYLPAPCTLLSGIMV